MESCTKHPGVSTDSRCGQCDLPFCEECTVFPFGASKPGMCLTCALAFAGVRRRGSLAPRKEPKAPKASRFGRKYAEVAPVVVEEEFVFDMSKPLY